VVLDDVRGRARGCGLILTAVIGTFLIAGKTNGGADPFEALKSAMIIGALPITMVMGLRPLWLSGG